MQIEAGGEVIITQLFYDVDRFLKFVKDVRGMGITVPIIPGMAPEMLMAWKAHVERHSRDRLIPP